jgi:hypothetical protein
MAYGYNLLARKKQIAITFVFIAFSILPLYDYYKVFNVNFRHVSLHIFNNYKPNVCIYFNNQTLKDSFLYNIKVLGKNDFADSLLANDDIKNHSFNSNCNSLLSIKSTTDEFNILNLIESLQGDSYKKLELKRSDKIYGYKLNEYIFLN